MSQLATKQIEIAVMRSPRISDWLGGRRFLASVLHFTLAIRSVFPILSSNRRALRRKGELKQSGTPNR